MAVKDVKEYYYKMLAQYLEMKADLADFEQALKDGFITEDQVVEAKEELAIPEDIETIKISENEINICDLLVKINFANSKGEAKRMIQGKGVKINGQTVEDIADDGYGKKSGKSYFICMGKEQLTYSYSHSQQNETAAQDVSGLFIVLIFIL